MSLIVNPEHGLVFGALDLIGRDKTGPFWFETLGEGADFGNPEQNFRVIETFLQDGAEEAVDSYGNREMTFEIMVVGEDSLALALGEAALFAEVDKESNSLTWTPPTKIVGAGTPCVFQIARAELAFMFDDLNELRSERHYKLTLHALPWARAEQMVEVPSDPPPISTTLTQTLINDGSSTTGWSVSPVFSGWVLSTTGTAIKVVGTRAGSSSYGQTDAVLSGLSISMTSTPFVRVDASASVSGTGSISAFLTEINGVVVPEVARDGNVAWYAMPTGQTTLNKVRLYAEGRLNAVGNAITILVNDVSRSNLASNESAGQKQTFRTFPMQGSVRTPGNLVISDETPTGLGSVLVYTTPASVAAQPPLRASRVAGSAETADTSLVSGKYSDLGTLHAFEKPAANVEPGGHLLIAKVKHASAGSKAITWAGKSVMGSTTLDGAPQTGVRNVTLAAGTWAIVTVAKLDLPTYTLGVAGKVRIEMQGPAGLLLDEAWICNVDTGRVTIVDCGAGTPAAGGPANRLWLDAASLDNPAPSIWLGTAADRSDAFNAGSRILSFGRHEFPPGGANAFVMATDSIAAKVVLSYYPSGFAHVVAAE